MVTVFENRATLPLLLSLNAGYVDTAGFLAFQGLFTAHVTGNFVTLGASLALGTSGALAKLLALPMFCAVVIAVRLLNTVLSNRHWPALELLIALKVLLLITGAALAIRFGPFHDVDSSQAVLSGMVLVGAMAIQNAFHRIHLASAPPSTPKGAESQSGARLVQMSTNLLFFAIGCGAAALLYSRVGVQCFLVPPVVGSLQLMVRLIGLRAKDAHPG